jgi:hypothetical protein
MRPPSGTVTFLLTDLEGSTRRWELDPIAKKGAANQGLAEENWPATLPKESSDLTTTPDGEITQAYITAGFVAARLRDWSLTLWLVYSARRTGPSGVKFPTSGCRVSTQRRRDGAPVLPTFSVRHTTCSPPRSATKTCVSQARP